MPHWKIPLSHSATLGYVQKASAFCFGFQLSCQSHSYCFFYISLQQIAAAQLGAQVTIQNTQVSSMKTIEHVLQASGDGTTALLKELTIKDNTNEDQFSWQYVEVTDGATVLVSDSQFTGNHNVMFGFHASAGGIINIRDVVATENRGALLVSPQEDDSVSSVVFANDGGTVSIYDSEFGNTDMITVRTSAVASLGFESRPKEW